MKVRTAKAQASRVRIVETASELFSEYGFDGVGVADLMGAAGFTHGGFYNQFRSKVHLMADAAQYGLSKTLKHIADMEVAEFIQQYVSRKHRDDRRTGCTMAALCSDAARQPDEVKATFAAFIERMLRVPIEREGKALSDVDQQKVRTQRVDMLAHAVGAIILSRACPDDSLLAEEIINVCRGEILTTLPGSETNITKACRVSSGR